MAYMAVKYQLVR